MPGSEPRLSFDDRRWLHDKFERLAAEEAQLASTRTTYYAAIGTVLITGLVVTAASFLSQPTIFVALLTFLSLLGILISFVWAVLLHRTNDAKNLWREAACRLEQEQPPVEGAWMVSITLRTNATIPVNLTRPFLAHAERFSSRNPVSWMDRANPDSLTEVLPVTFITLWSVVLVLGWTWFLFFR
ncbi:MAG TPA: hypothetical protein VEY07_00190 [Thermoplasmata archaeon]|nr:hypothetical protein [Thermoplasmata archaeon]